MNIQLRDATKDDADFLYQLHRAAMQTYVVQTWGEWDESWQSMYFLKNFDPNNCQIIIVDQQDVGMISVIRREADIFVKQLAVLPDFQSKGIGTQLVLSLADEASRKNLPLTLQVLKVNPARELYERLGFSVTGETITHYEMKKYAAES